MERTKMAFHVGQKIVCINTKRLSDRETIARFLSEGAIYTIRKVGECPYAPYRKWGPVVWLEEIIVNGGNSERWPDFPFAALRFRPLVEKSTDAGMAILRDILDRETIKDDKPIKKPAKVR
jgi:hypothetical protein